MVTDPARQPAPGSDVPGAPPSLTRALTPEDGVLIRGKAEDAAGRHEPVRHRSTTEAARTPASPYLAALGLTVAALTVTADAWWRRHRAARRRPPGSTVVQPAAHSRHAERTLTLEPR